MTLTQALDKRMLSGPLESILWVVRLDNVLQNHCCYIWVVDPAGEAVKPFTVIPNMLPYIMEQFLLGRFTDQDADYFLNTSRETDDNTDWECLTAEDLVDMINHAEPAKGAT